MRLSSRVACCSLLTLLTLMACGGTGPAPAKAVPTARPADAPVTVADWKDLCEAQAERARRCPGPVPEPIAACTERAACFGALVRGDVVRSLAKCQSQNDCARPCTIDRVTTTLPMTAANREIEEACVARRALCPALDCNALVRPVQSLDGESTMPLVECFRFEKSCLDVAACVLETMSPVIARVSRCAPGGLEGARESP